MTTICDLLRSSRQYDFTNYAEIAGAVTDGFGRRSGTNSLSALCRFVVDTKACKSAAVVLVWENTAEAVAHFGTDFDQASIDWRIVINRSYPAPAKQSRAALIELLPIEAPIGEFTAYFAFVREACSGVKSEPETIAMDWLWSEVMGSATRTLALANSPEEIKLNNSRRIRSEIEFFPNGGRYL